MTGREKSLTLLEKALAELTKAGAKGGLATLHSGESALTRFANNHIHQNVLQENASLSLVAAVGKRLGAAGTNRLDRGGVSACAKQAVAIAKQAADDSEFPGFPAAPAVPEIPAARDAKTAALPPAARAKLVARAVKYAAANGASAAGKVSSGWGEMAIASTAGTRQYSSGTSFAASCTAMIEGAAGSEDWTASAMDTVAAQLENFGRPAVDTALAARKPVRVDAGDWPVVFAPRAVATLVDFLAYLGFEPLAHQENRSCLAGKLGTRIASESITLRDDGLAPEAMPLPFDFEGVPRRPLTLIEAGVARELPHSTRTAKKAGTQSTGHSFGPMSSMGALPMHLVLQPGGATMEAMIASTPKGLFVNRFWYTNVAEPTRAVITGMTRDGLFLIENGKIAGPVCNMRFTESVLDALSRVEAVGSEIQPVGGEWDGGVTRVPALKLSAFRFTGVTEF